MIALAFALMGWLTPHPDLGRQLAAARRGITSPKVAESLAAHETGHTPPSGIPSSSGIVAAHGSLPAVLGSFPSAVPPPSGFTLPQGSHGEVMFNDTRNRQSVRPELHAATGGGASVQHAGYFSRHPGVACLTKAAAAFGVGYLIASFGEDHDTRTVFVVPQHDGDGDDDNDHHEGHGHRKDCKR